MLGKEDLLVPEHRDGAHTAATAPHVPMRHCIEQSDVRYEAKLGAPELEDGFGDAVWTTAGTGRPTSTFPTTAESQGTTDMGGAQGAMTQPGSRKITKKQTKKPVATGIMHDWKLNGSSKRWECHVCGSFSRKNESNLERHGCPGESPLDFDKLRKLRHKPVSYDCSDGDVITVCTACYATSSPTSAATSFLSKLCLGTQKHNHKRMQERYHQTILKGRHPQKKDVLVFQKKGMLA